MGKGYIDDIFGLRRGTILVVFVLVFGSGLLFGYVRAWNYSFKGVITKVSYDEPKHIPTITINGINYNLIYDSWNNYNDTLAVGDSAIKQKGTTVFILTKKKYFHTK